MSPAVSPYPTPDELHQALLAALAPITRYRIPATGTAVAVNANGVDHHDGQVGPVRLDADGRAHAYIATYEDNGRLDNRRTPRRGSQMAWGVTLTVAGGDPDRARWAVAQVRTVLDGATLTLPADPPTRPDPTVLTTGLLEQLGGLPVRPDETVSPTRWVTQLRYAATARRPQ